MTGLDRRRAMELAETLLAARGTTRIQILPVVGQPDRFYVDGDLTADSYDAGAFNQVAHVIEEAGLRAYFDGTITVRARGDFVAEPIQTDIEALVALGDKGPVDA